MLAVVLGVLALRVALALVVVVRVAVARRTLNNHYGSV